jgi:prepilin peptidase CpaA
LDGEEYSLYNSVKTLPLPTPNNPIVFLMFVVVEMKIFIIILLTCLILPAAFFDLRSYRIPNILTYGFMFIGILFHSCVSGYEGFIFSTAGTLTGIGLLFFPYFFGIMGAGDAKFLGAIGSILGMKEIIIVFLFSAIIGGVSGTLIILINHKKYKRFFSDFYHGIKGFILTKQLSPLKINADNKKPKLCYGVSIAIGTGIYTLLNIYSIKVIPL